MSVLSQSLLTLVRRHLVSLMLLSVWHNFMILWLVLIIIQLFERQRYNYFFLPQKVSQHFVEKNISARLFARIFIPLPAEQGFKELWGLRKARNASPS